jgi:3-phosphoshikimate 1-carboxyvinyltransferase
LIIRLSKASSGLVGEITPPPDKSISHRAVILSSIARGRGIIRNFLRSADTLSTLAAFKALGVSISESDNGEIVIEGKGLHGLKEPEAVIDCGNSGTTMRLLSGLLSGNSFFSVLAGDESLAIRPMGRVIEPLAKMDARIMARKDDKYPPLAIRGGSLKSIRYEMPIASAQVKSAILLAGLYANGETEVVETLRSRDHTERMLRAYGADIEISGLSIKIKPGAELTGVDFEIPSDFSSAAFFISAAAVVEGSDLTIKSVGINPTRTGFLDVINKMGADFEVKDKREVSGEPVADIYIRHSKLKAVEVGEEMMPSLIDEFPVLCVLAARAKGTTRITGAGELRVKECDRIRAMAEGLKKMGTDVEELEDGLVIGGDATLKGAQIQSFGDHRVAMAFSIAALVAEGETAIDEAQAVDISFPGFFDMLSKIKR